MVCHFEGRGEDDVGERMRRGHRQGLVMLSSSLAIGIVAVVVGTSASRPTGMILTQLNADQPFPASSRRRWPDSSEARGARPRGNSLPGRGRWPATQETACPVTRLLRCGFPRLPPTLCLAPRRSRSMMDRSHRWGVRDLQQQSWHQLPDPPTSVRAVSRLMCSLQSAGSASRQ